MPQSLYELIAAHATAFARFERVCDRTDETLAKLEGRTVAAEDHRVWEEAEAVLDKALDALVLVVPETVVELHRKAEYLISLVRHGTTMDIDQQLSLLSSLSEFRVRRAA